MKRNALALLPKPKVRKGRGWEKRDWAETEARHFKDKRSYVGFRVHPGTSHCCVYLKGVDAREAKLRIYQRDEGKCFRCGEWVCISFADLEHEVGGDSRERCWCDENLRIADGRCHRIKDGRNVRLGRIGVTV